MDQPSTEQLPDFRRYFWVVRRQRFLIGLVTAVAIVAALVITLLQSSVYQASMKVVVGQQGGIFQPQYGGSVQPSVETVANLFTSDVVASTTISKLGLHITPSQLIGNTTVATTPDSSVLNVSYKSPQSAQAVRILGEMGSVFSAEIKQRLAAPSSGGAQTGGQITATVFDPAHLDPGAVSPQPTRTVAIAAGLGLAIGLVIAFLLEGISTRIRSERDAENWFGAPVLGALRVNGQRMISPTSDRGAGVHPSDVVSILRESLHYPGARARGAITTIASVDVHDSSSALVVDLAFQLAGAGSHVICVEADLRRPSLREHLSLPPIDHGLANVLDGDVELSDALVVAPARASGNGSSGRAGRVEVLVAGKSQRSPSELLTAARVKQLVRELRGLADYVIFHAPPILASGDALPIARASDDVIVVATEGSTTRESAMTVRLMLERLEVARVGVVLVDAQARSRVASANTTG